MRSTLGKVECHYRRIQRGSRDQVREETAATGDRTFKAKFSPPPILYKDHFYVQYTINERSDGLVCMTMDGQIKWKTGDEAAFNKGGAILVEDLLLATDGNKLLYFIEPDPSGFKPLASAELLESGQNWAPLALVAGKLLLWDQINW
jgi:hypothetical protein